MRRISIRTKILAAILAVFVVAMVAFYFASYNLILKQFTKIERQTAATNNNSAVNALNNQVDQLRLKGIDWAYWDDTYRYIVDHNQAYSTANIVPATLSDLQINYMLFYDLSGHLVSGLGIDLASGKTVAVPAALTSQFKVGSPLLMTASDGTPQAAKGLLSTPTDPMMMIALPILTTGSGGPARGTFVFAKYLDSAQTDKLKSLTNLNLSYVGIGALPPSIGPNDLSDGKTLVRPVGSNQVVSYSIVNDIYNHPLLVARVIDNRDIYQQGRHSIAVFMVTISFIGLLSLVIGLFISNQLIQKDQVIRLKNEFFSIASHELRTPLTAIRGNSSMLLDLDSGALAANQKEMVQSIYQSSTDLIKVVNHFLDAARLEQGSLKFYPSTFLINEVVQAVVNELGPLVHQRNLEITIVGCDDLPAVFADRERVREIIYNLVGNSIKYTEHGGITITGKLAGSNIEITIADSGIGMTEEEKQRTFTKFQTGQYGGVGLGLYISKMLATMMSGRLDLVESTLGHGTTFMFSLPLASQRTVNISRATTISELSKAAATGDVAPSSMASHPVDDIDRPGETILPGSHS